MNDEKAMMQMNPESLLWLMPDGRQPEEGTSRDLNEVVWTAPL
jgi:hypothetical protein